MGPKTLAILAPVVLAGCGTLVHGQYDVVRVIATGTYHSGAGAKCVITQGSNQFRLEAPSSITLPRGGQLRISCTHPVAGSGTTVVTSKSSNVSLFGTALLAGGPVAAGLLGGMEGMSGAAFDYPDSVTVRLVSSTPAAQVRVQALDPAGAPVEAFCVFIAGGTRWLVATPGEVTFDTAPPEVELTCRNETLGEAVVVLERRPDGSYPKLVQFRFPPPEPSTP